MASTGWRHRAGSTGGMTRRLRSQLAGSYPVWRLYHLLVADAVALQKPTKFRLIYDFLGDHLGVVADVGCGPGVFARYLRAHATTVWAVDVDWAALRRLRARNRHNSDLRFVAAEATRLPFPESSLDTLVFLEVLEHVVNDRGALQELSRVLKPGGILVLSVPVPPGETNDDVWGHKREGYTLPQLVELLEANEFVVEERGFAQFTFSRLAEKAIRFWRRTFHLPAPIFLSWICYLDHMLNVDKRRLGGHSPSSLVVLARREAPGQSNRDIARQATEEAGLEFKLG
jgi:SAM-dependent methyltransferase